MKRLYLLAYLVVMTGNGHVSINKLDTMQQCRVAACMAKKAGACSFIESCDANGEPKRYPIINGQSYSCAIATRVDSAECLE